MRDPDLILKVSDGKLPVILVNITYDTDTLKDEEFAPLETEFNLRLAIAENIYI